MAQQGEPESKSTKKPRVVFDPGDFELITNAAYWEGFPSAASFVRATVDRYLAIRLQERGKPYPPSEAKKRGRPRKGWGE